MKTNRDYYSWSQYYLFLTSKREFHKRYVLGEPSLPNIYFNKGKELCEYKETGLIPHWADPLLKLVGDAVVSLKNIEEEINVEIETLVGVKKLKMFLDTSDGVGNEFYEYKTGKEPWDQFRVDNHEQLDFYACGIYLKYGTIPKCKLFWVETEEFEDEKSGFKELKFTGNVESFERTFTEQEIIAMLSKIMLFIQDVEDFKFEEVNVDDNDIDRYIELTEQKQEIDDELNLIKLKIQTIINENDAQYAVGTNGRFSVSKRANYSFSKELTSKKDKYDKEIKAEEAKEKKTGVATVYYTESLRFNKLK